MEGRSKSGSGGEWHVRVSRVGVEIKMSVIKIGIIGIAGVKIGVLEVVGVIGM